MGTSMHAVRGERVCERTEKRVREKRSGEFYERDTFLTPSTGIN